MQAMGTEYLVPIIRIKALSYIMEKLAPNWNKNGNSNRYRFPQGTMLEENISKEKKKKKKRKGFHINVLKTNRTNLWWHNCLHKSKTYL